MSGRKLTKLREIVELFIYNVIFVRTWDGNVGEDKVVKWLEDQIKSRLAVEKILKSRKLMHVRIPLTRLITLSSASREISDYK